MWKSVAMFSNFLLGCLLWHEVSVAGFYVRPQLHRVARSSPNRIRRSDEIPEFPTMTQFHVTSRVTSRYSNVVVAGVVQNDANIAQEAFMEMRLPKTAFISNFSMEIEGVTYVGVVKDKHAARRQYQDAVSQGQTAGLISAKMRESQTFEVAVNVAAGSSVSFKLDYQELLKRRLGVYNHVIYADPSQLVQDFKIEVLITETSEITKLSAKPSSAPSSDNLDAPALGDVQIRRSGSQAHILYRPTWEQQDLWQISDHSFLVRYDVTREKVGGDLLIKDGYFVHFFAPSNLPVMPKNVVFVIDKSGSMSGRKMLQTQKAFLTILDDLSPQDKFNIITFSGVVETWEPNRLLPATRRNVARAKTFVRTTFAHGSTNFELAARTAISLLETASNASSSLETASMLLMLTDGRPTAGVTRTSDIRASVKRQVAGRYSVFCLGFGSDVDHSFLNKLASENQGLSRRIYADADASLQLKGFYDEVASPLLAHVIIKYSGTSARSVTKQSFDNFFDGSEISVAGALTEDGEELSAVTVGDSVMGKVTLFSKAEHLDVSVDDNDFDMEKLWAYLTIQQMQEKKENLEGDDTRRVGLMEEKLLRLSLKYNFVTKLTSMVVTTPDDQTLESNDPMQRSEDLYQDFTEHLEYPEYRPLLSVLQDPQLQLSRSYFSFHHSSSLGMSSVLLDQETTTTTTPSTTTPPTAASVNVTFPANPLNLTTQCFSNIQIDRKHNISSPRFPGLYPANTECVWMIQKATYQNDENPSFIRLSFRRLDMEWSTSCHRDRILVYPNFSEGDQEPVIQSFCGYQHGFDYVDAIDSLVVVFQSDNLVEGRGFQAELELRDLTS